MKIRDVLDTHGYLARSYHILMKKEELSDDEIILKTAIERAKELCEYIYDNTDFCGVMEND